MRGSSSTAIDGDPLDQAPDTVAVTGTDRKPGPGADRKQGRDPVEHHGALVQPVVRRERRLQRFDSSAFPALRSR